MLFTLIVLLQGTIVFLGVIQANVITECRDENNCIKNYSDVYNSLRSEGNYYNIALALYPSREPSSVLVHVNLSSTNESDHQPEGASPLQYTWSMSCLYAAIPAKVLEILSLGAILITRRTRDLDMTIPPFCCNVSKDERIVIIDRVLSELQDLADSPKIQNPALNTAECVTKGHIPDISTVTKLEKRIIIRVMLWSSFGFSFFFGPLLALTSFILHPLTKTDKTQEKKQKWRRVNLAKATKYTIFICVAIELVLFVLVLIFAGISKALWDIYIILVVIFFEAILASCLIVRKSWFDFGKETNQCEIAFTFIWGNLTAFHVCWLVIGIMINPLWGVTVLLAICIITSAIVFAVYNILFKNRFKFRFMCICFFFVLSVMFLLVVVILSGQAFFGRESANELLKTALLYVITAFISWIAKKFEMEDKNENTKKSRKGQKAEGNKRDEESKL